MPYYIQENHPDCSEEWSVVKSDGELIACHATKQSAIDQALAISLEEGEEFLGQREVREVNLEAPSYFRASARRGLEWYQAGLGGDGLVERTIREARSMAEGNITADKWVRLRAWISRHLVDLESAAEPGDDNYPTPGQVAMALWGGGSTRRSARRALEYADNIVNRIREENEGRAKGAALSKLETRLVVTDLEIREVDNEGMTLTGYAALFDSLSEDLGGFREKIAPGAFKRSLKSRNDIKLLWNHDSSEVLASTRAGTLTLTEDSRGLRVEAQLAPTQRGKDTAILVKRGDVSGFSFGFSIPERGGDSWSEDGKERTLKSVRLFEVSLTSFPAYTATNGTASVRGIDKVAQRAEVDADALADALLKLESGEDISKEESELLTRVISKLSPVEEQPVAEEQPKPDLAMLALKKKRLELLEKGY